MKTMILTSTLLISFLGFYTLAHAEEDFKNKEAHFREADTNNDGKISFDEFKVQHEKHMSERFKKVDANGDGYIDEAERKAAHEKMRALRKEQAPK